MGNFNGLPKTTNIQLNKPGYDNAADIEALNENADIIDALLQRLLLLTDNIKKTYARTVNGNGVNSNGEVTVDVGVKKVNGVSPDSGGNVKVEEYTHPASGVTAGTYDRVTVNAQGHIISGSKAKAFISASYTSGTSWYRKWSDGWIEQGGKGVASGYSSRSQTNNLFLPFSNTNYTIVCTKLDSDTSAAITVVQKTTTTFNMSCHGQGGSGFSATSDIEWYACGY